MTDLPLLLLLLLLSCPGFGRMSANPPDSAHNKSGPDSRSRSSRRLGPVETSILEYVLHVHGRDATRRAQLISLFVHAQLLARGARPSSGGGETQYLAVLGSPSLDEDPIRLSYTLVPRPGVETLSSVTSQLQLSVAETDSKIFVNLTDTTTDKFGHTELSGLEHVRLSSEITSGPTDIHNVYPRVEELLDAIEENLWKPVLPTPPLNRVTEPERKREKPDSATFPNEPQRFPPAAYDNNRGRSSNFPFPDYGRSDLDPLGSAGTRGGMILDPRRPIAGPPFGSGGSFLGGPDVLPPGSVPPGARFDPFGPGIVPDRLRFGNPPHTRGPDPDHALPPGFDDMYL
ncbi:unnamed protein product [Dicrocoelium dendriticum]|nr:unnamed protein product [Dicrocoelium dendriticum]